ncbi:MAG: hypothetical protein WB586_26905 [Chthoniobacterales bacterium]
MSRPEDEIVDPNASPVTEVSSPVHGFGTQKAKGELLKHLRGFPLLTALILTLPSLYFLTFVPPLWRDSDGFFQVASPLSYLTVLQWPPLYCFAARVPILFGALMVGAALAHGLSFNHPVFTDSGVFYLLLVQHILLICVLLVACVTITERRWLRWSIAALFASNPVLYAFANCVGSEALSNVTTLLVAVIGLSFIRNPSSKHSWFLFVALLAGILTRHVNGILSALVPGTLLLIITLRALSRVSFDSCSGSGRGYHEKLLRMLGLSAFVGIASIVAASATVWVICRIDKIPDVSRFGYVFQWRLDYLAKLQAQDREATLARISRQLNDPATRYALDQLDARLNLKQPWTPDVVSTALDKWLKLEERKSWKESIAAVDRRLNKLAAAFLFSGDRYLYQAILDDFGASLRFSPDQICREPFDATDWLNLRIDQKDFNGIRGLETFRHPAGTFHNDWSHNFYFNWWRAIPLWLLASLTILQISIGLAWNSFEHSRSETFLFALGLLVTGGVLCLANCSLTALASRFILSSYILLLLALTVSTVGLIESSWDRRVLARTRALAQPSDANRWNG